MRHLFVAIALVLFALTGISNGMVNGTLETWAFPTTTDVVLLTLDNFDTYLKETEMLFVEFFDQWCAACMKVADDYEEVATTMKNIGSNIVIAKVDALRDPPLPERYDVKGYPTFMLFRHGTPVNFNRPFEKQYILEFLESKKISTSLELKTKEELDTFLKTMDKPKAIAVVDDDKLKTWKSFTDAENLPFAFAHTYDPSILGNGAIDGTLRIFSPIENEPVDMEYVFDKSNIGEFLEKQKNPLIRLLNNAVWYEHAEKNASLYVILFKKGEENLQLAKDVAKAVEGKATITFRILDEYHLDFINEWTVSGEFFPTAVQITWNELVPKYAAYDEETGPFNIESAVDFIERSLKGKYAPYIRSDPIPETNDGPVKIVVGKNFQEIAMNPNKFTAILLYTSWCPYSQATLPIWEEIAVAFSKQDNIIFAKSDLSTNSLPSILSSYDEVPTIVVMMNNEEKKVIDFEGEKGAKQIATFIAKTTGITDIDLSVLSDVVPQVEDEEYE